MKANCAKKDKINHTPIRSPGVCEVLKTIVGLRGVIIGYRGGLRTRREHEFLLGFEGFNTAKKAHRLLNRRVAWRSPTGKEIVGRVVAVHGKGGVVRARFRKGLPGEALGSEIGVIG